MMLAFQLTDVVTVLLTGTLGIPGIALVTLLEVL